MIYLYDGSFEGLLTAIFEAYNRHEIPERILSEANYQPGILDEYLLIKRDDAKAERVYNSIRTKISPTSLENIYYTYLSEYDETGTWIYQYVKLGLVMGKKVEMHLSDDRALRIHKTNLKVTCEMHKLLGMLRFNRLSNDIFYAPLEPRYNIVSLIAPHFAERMPDQNWVIHDVKRRIAAVHNQEGWFMTPFEFNQHIAVDQKEALCQELWKQYFDSIAISTRHNPKLQKQLMPVRYWKYLTEKQVMK